VADKGKPREIVGHKAQGLTCLVTASYPIVALVSMGESRSRLRLRMGKEVTGQYGSWVAETKEEHSPGALSAIFLCLKS